MDDEERQRRAAELRERIRQRGGTSEASRTGEDTGGERPAIDYEERTALQTSGRALRVIAPTGGEPGESSRRAGGRDSSLRGFNRRHRSGGDGRREGDEQSADDSAASFDGLSKGSGRTTIGRLEADGEAFRLEQPDPSFTATRQEDRKVPAARYRIDYFRTFRNKKRVYVHKGDQQQFITPDEWKLLPERPVTDETAKPFKQPEPPKQDKLFGKSQVLTEQEIRELAEPFREALKDIGGYTDQGLWVLNPNEKGNDIWGDLTDLEAELLAKHLFKLGQKSPVVAVAIRETVHLKEYAALVAIILPRVRKTKRLVDTAPPRPRKKRSLFRVVEGSAG